MRGLVVKDIELMKQQKQFFILVLVMGVVLNLMGNSSSGFVTGYFTIITAIFTVTTMSYDEFDNGMAFLMTLPISRKEYVKEKYFLGIGLTGVAWVIAVVLALICNFTEHKGRDIGDIFASGTAMICIAFLMLAVIIPMSIYYGVEKGRQIAVVLWIILIAVIYALVETAVISESILDAWLGGTNLGKTFFITAFVTVMGYLSSWRISEQLMEKKEF